VLHMLVNVHSPDHCGFRPDAEGTALRRGFEQLAKSAEGKGASVQGTWVNTASHTAFALIEAPNAHVVDEIVRDTGLTIRSESRVYSVEAMQELLETM
jgi:hypothetical protein